MKQKKIPGVAFSLYIGIFAGIIWGVLKISEYRLKFTNIAVGFLIKPFFTKVFLDTWIGLLLGEAVFILFSMMAAVVYYTFLRKAKGPYYGISYGISWWLLLYLLVGPLCGMMSPLYNMNLTSTITDGCLFILWGLFIGYSIAFEYTNEQNRES